MRFEDRVKTLFDSVVSHPAPDWERLLAESAEGQEVKAEVRRLLEFHAQTTGFLSKPAAEAFPSIIREMGSHLGEFTLIREIGRGGMGVVYLAEDAVLGRRVALKILARSALTSEHDLARFRTEAKAAARLAHPGIVPVYRYGEQDGTHYIVMEYVEGETLAQRLEALKDSTSKTSTSAAERHVREMVEIVAAIAEALDYAHRQRVIHRDVKPSNILIAADGKPRLADFGVARIGADSSLTVTGEIAGTFYYMSPEQARASGTHVDHRTDIFSLGVVLYECLARRRPFVGESSQQVMQALTTADPVPLRKLNRAVSRELATVCEKALEKSPEDRYPTAGHFAADLRGHLSGEGVMVRRSLRRKGLRWVKKHRAGVTAIVLVTLAISVVILAFANHAARRATLGGVTVLIGSGETDAVVRAQRVDEFGARLGPVLDLGRAPIHDVRLPSGLYRISVSSGRGAFAEFDDYLVPGRSVTRTAWLREVEATLEGMVRIEGAERAFVLKDLRTGVPASHRLAMPALLVDEAEVSNIDYKRFVDATGHKPPDIWPPSGLDVAMNDLPVVGVSHSQALAYALWRGQRLPTIGEWMALAQAPDGRLHPWGAGPAPEAAVPSADVLREQLDVSELGTATAYLRRASAVRSGEERRNPLGMYHMFGNVGEMSGTVFLNQAASAVVVAVARTSWLSDPRYCDLSDSGTQPYGTGSRRIGFRCVRDVRPTIGGAVP